jgi:hypothetical protein
MKFVCAELKAEIKKILSRTMLNGKELKYVYTNKILL